MTCATPSCRWGVSQSQRLPSSTSPLSLCPSRQSLTSRPVGEAGLGREDSMLLRRRSLWMLVLLFMGGIVGSCSQYDLEDVGQAENPAGKPTAQHGLSGAAVRSGSSDFRKIVALVPVWAAQMGTSMRARSNHLQEINHTRGAFWGCIRSISKSFSSRLRPWVGKSTHQKHRRACGTILQRPWYAGTSASQGRDIQLVVAGAGRGSHASIMPSCPRSICRRHRRPRRLLHRW
jgi:hypothetical protein